MKNSGENTVSDLIYLFIDGETDEVQQTTLFKELASSSELQSEFQQALEINKGFANDRSVLLPSSSLKDAVFLKAGWSAAGAGAGTAAVVKTAGLASKLANLPLLLSNLAKPALTAALSSIITALAVLFLINPLIYNSESSKTTQTGQGIIPVVKSMPAAETPKSENSPVNKHLNSNISQAGYKDKSSISDRNIINHKIVPNFADENVNITEENTPEYPGTIRILNSSEIPLNRGLELPGNISNTRASLGLHRFSDIKPFNLNIYTPENLNVELRSLSGLSYFPSREIDADDKTVINDIALALRYKFDDENLFGIQIGKESLQIYSIYKTDAGYELVKEPSIFWIAAFWRHNLKEWQLFDRFYPYFDIISGFAAKYGILEKGIIGLTYDSDNILSMSLGLEGTAMSYSYLGKVKMTGKLGLTYAIGIHF